MFINDQTSTNINKLILQFLLSFTVLTSVTLMGLVFILNSPTSVSESLKQAIYFASVTSATFMIIGLITLLLSTQMTRLETINFFNLNFSRLKLLLLICFSSIYLFLIDQHLLTPNIQPDKISIQQRQPDNPPSSEKEQVVTEQTREPKAVVNDEMPKVMMDDMALITALGEGNWDEVAINAKSDSKLQRQILEAGMMIALLENAPTSLIDKLIDSGTKLDNQFRHAVFTNGDLPYLKALLDRGMTLDGFDASGHTSLTSNLSSDDSERKKEMFNFLIKQGLDTNTRDQNGKTPMDHALQQYDSQNAIHYIQTLIEKKATITPENLRKIETIKSQQPDIYQSLTSKVPQLIIDS